MKNEGKLKWKFDISAFRLIGRDLITDRVTALYELVKNCYDANARVVNIYFENVSSDKIKDRRIIIQDDGYGMSFEDIRDKWMVIGTASKRNSLYSPEPFHRRYVGEKGIGRFAVDKLGDKVTIKTKKSGSPQWLSVDIDWSEFESLSESPETFLFTDMENSYSVSSADDIEEHGTQITISNVNEKWTQKDVDRFLKQSYRIVSPFTNLSEPFDIHVYASEFDIDINTDKAINQEETSLATLTGHIDFGPDYQEYLFFDKKTLSLQKSRGALQSFGGIKMALYFFDGKARKEYKSKYQYSHIDGIKIYRDGVITTPFAESEDEISKQRDVLGIEKERWESMFDKVSSREIIGYIHITKEGNPDIIDATNRQDFCDTPEYRDLKKFILRQLSTITEYKKFIREKEQTQVSKNLHTVSSNLYDFSEDINKIASLNPTLGKELSPLAKRADKLRDTITTTLKQQEQIEAEFVRKENMYISMMSLQEYAIQVAHAVRTSLSRIKSDAEYFYDFFPNEEEEDLFKEYAKEMFEEMQILDQVINYILSYSSSNIEFKEFDSKTLLQSIFNGYSLKFDSLGIATQFELIENLSITCNMQMIKEILQNLIDNSIKAMKDSSTKIIKCTSYIEDEKLVILLSDTGKGIAKEDREWVFGLYNTTTEDQGGGGVGLYVVKSRVKSLKGEVFVTDSEFAPLGATIKIVLPFKK